MKLKCFKGFADSENLNVICLKGDVVELINSEEGTVLVVGVAGFCVDMELCFTPKEIVEHFERA
jgi:hypothetical protein